jgi:hypothetical protein
MPTQSSKPFITSQSTLSTSTKGKDSIHPKIAVITSCSKQKAKFACSAFEFYRGQFFQAVKNFTFKHDFDLWLVSAKYGLIGDEIVFPYDRKLKKSKAEQARIKDLVYPRFHEIEAQYDKIIVLMGKTYRDTLPESSKIIFGTDHRGSGGYKQLIKILSQFPYKKVKTFFQNQQKEFTVTDLRRVL